MIQNTLLNFEKKMVRFTKEPQLGKQLNVVPLTLGWYFKRELRPQKHFW